MEEHETISGEDAQRIIKGEMLELKAKKQAEGAEKENTLNSNTEVKGKDAVDIDKFATEIAKAMVQLRCDQEKEIFDKLWQRGKH